MYSSNHDEIELEAVMVQCIRPTVLSENIPYTTPWFRVIQQRLSWPNGHAHDMFIVESRPFVVIILEHEGELLLVRQYRPTEEIDSIEFPKGRIEAGENPEVAARREVVEETGVIPKTLVRLGEFVSGIGQRRCRGTAFIARGIEGWSKPQLDESEQGLESMWKKISDWRESVRNGEILDGDSIAAWGLYREWEEGR